ncbi:MAG: hypothetical protein RL385_468 [Pseudomonadota bacterium]|jgi:hypothetical protein
MEARIAETEAAGDLLAQHPLRERATWLARAFATLADAETPLGKRAREELPASTGLSAAMIEACLRDALDGLSADALVKLIDAIPAPFPRALAVRAGRLCVVVLAGNVFTAVLRAVLWPLLLGLPVIAKAASADSLLPRLLESALRADPSVPFAKAFSVVGLEDHDDPALRALLDQADVVSVYGGDDTLSALREQLSASTVFQGHGHGLGAAFVARAALVDNAHAGSVAVGLARDVAAYDQRGCMSPHCVWVEAGGHVDAEAFGSLLHVALGALEPMLPRGAIPFEVAAAQLSYRGVGALRGRVLTGRAHAVCIEGQAELRLSPGYRNVQVLAVEDEAALLAQLRPLGVHLKVLGLAGVTDVRGFSKQLPARVAPRLCPIGHMQSPAPDALADGLPPWEGLLRYVELQL